MKKKIISLIAALACVSAGTMGLVACGDGGDGGGGGGEKTVTGLVIVDGDGTEYNSYDLGNINYGAIPNMDDLQLYIKYSDGTKILVEDGSGISVAYYHNGDAIAELDAFDVGNYRIEYSYAVSNGLSCGVTISFTVNTALISPYSLSLESNTWKYLNDPVMTVKKGDDEIDVSNYSIYAIAEAKYNEIKSAADFKGKLNENKVYYDYESVNPGRYYLYAEMQNIASDVTSDFKLVVIQKGDVTPTNTDNFNGYYSYAESGAIGNIDLSEVEINTHNTQNITAEWKNSKGKTVSGQLQWVNPNDKVNSAFTGRKKVKWVPTDEDADRYNEYIVQEPIPLNIEKGVVHTTGLDYGWKEWNGEDYEVKLFTSNNYKSFMASVDATYNGNPITLTNDGLLGTVSEIGEYTYKFALKDKINYYWDDNEDPDNTSDIADKTLTFEIKAITPWVYVPDDHTIDDNLQVKIKLAPGPESDGSKNITPYVAGSLQVEILPDYFHTTNEETGDGYKLETEIEAEAEVIKEGGFDYIVITVKDFKEVQYRGRIIIQVTATGDEHYGDIDRIFDDIHIEKYSFSDIPECPITDGEIIEKPVGTKVKELYEVYEGLETALGKWVMYIKYTPYSNWSEVTDLELSLPSGEYSFKAVYRSNFVSGVDNIEPVEFTVKGVEANS